MKKESDKSKEITITDPLQPKFISRALGNPSDIEQSRLLDRAQSIIKKHRVREISQADSNKIDEPYLWHSQNLNDANEFIFNMVNTINTHDNDVVRQHMAEYEEALLETLYADVLLKGDSIRETSLRNYIKELSLSSASQLVKKWMLQRFETPEYCDELARYASEHIDDDIFNSLGADADEFLKTPDDSVKQKVFTPDMESQVNSNSTSIELNALEEIEYIRSGKINNIVDAYAIELTKRALQINRSKHNKSLDTASDSHNTIYSVNKIWVMANDVFNSEEIAKEWIGRKNYTLGDLSPVELLDTLPGIKLVENVLNNIRHGMAA